MCTDVSCARAGVRRTPISCGGVASVCVRPMLPNKSVSCGHLAEGTPIRAHLACALRASRSMYTVMRDRCPADTLRLRCPPHLHLVPLMPPLSRPRMALTPAICLSRHLRLSAAPPRFALTPAVHHLASLPSQPRLCACILAPRPLSSVRAAAYAPRTAARWDTVGCGAPA